MSYAIIPWPCHIVPINSFGCLLFQWFIVSYENNLTCLFFRRTYLFSASWLPMLAQHHQQKFEHSKNLWFYLNNEYYLKTSKMQAFSMICIFAHTTRDFYVFVFHDIGFSNLKWFWSFWASSLPKLGSKPQQNIESLANLIVLLNYFEVRCETWEVHAFARICIRFTYFLLLYVCFVAKPTHLCVFFSVVVE